MMSRISINCSTTRPRDASLSRSPSRSAIPRTSKLHGALTASSPSSLQKLIFSGVPPNRAVFALNVGETFAAQGIEYLDGSHKYFTTMPPRSTIRGAKTSRSHRPRCPLDAGNVTGSHDVEHLLPTTDRQGPAIG